MIPRKPKDLYKQVAEDMNISETLVDNFMTFYYKEVRKNLTELKYSKINLDGLGVMTVKPKTVEGLINKYTCRFKKLNTDTFTSYFNKKRIETKLNRLNNIKGILDQEKQLKERFLKDKADGKTGKDLEE